MVGKSRIVAIGQGGTDAPAGISASADNAEEPLALDASWAEPEFEEEADAPAARNLAWVAPLLTGLAALGWTGFYIWTNRAQMLAPATPAQWVSWISDWSPTVLLLAVAYLIAMRSSSREASRFGDAARLLHDESVALETRLVTVNQELSLAREFIAAQARDLESLGRLASERLSRHAASLKDLIHENGAQIASIGDVSEAALDNMEKLRSQLPVIANSTKDVTSNIGQAGRAAQLQLQDLVQGFHKLNEFGVASERQVESLRKVVDDVLGAFTNRTEQLEVIARDRFIALGEQSEEFRTRLDQQEIEALAAIRGRAAALAEELGQSRETLDGHEAESITSLRSRLTTLRDESTTLARALRDGESGAVTAWRESLAAMQADMHTAIATLQDADAKAMDSARHRLTDEALRFDARIAERNRKFTDEMQTRAAEAENREAAAAEHLLRRLATLDGEIATRLEKHEEHARSISAHADAVTGALAEFATQMGDIRAEGSQAEATIAATLQTLASHLAASREALTGTDREIAQLTDSSVRLLELLQASAKQTREDLPLAIAEGETRLADIERRAIALRDTIGEAGTSGESLSAYVLATQETLVKVAPLQEAIAERNTAHREALGELQGTLGAIGSESAAITEATRTAFDGAAARLSEAAGSAVAQIETIGGQAAASFAGKLDAAGNAAIDRILETRAGDIAARLEEASAKAANASREAAIQLRDQLAKVNELAGNLEQRVSHARQRAEEQVDNDFARRAALVTESLNSNSIDIARALDASVADTAWASYLKGDRGIFTRRAVKLLDNAEAKAIAQVYEADDAFRDHVSRYIHDFEAMLRQLLSTRDGHALGVTLLSSDMGKLYVALAQAIERLRN